MAFYVVLLVGEKFKKNILFLILHHIFNTDNSKYHSAKVFDNLSITILVLSDIYLSILPITFTKFSIFCTPFLNLSIFSALDSSSCFHGINNIGVPTLGVFKWPWRCFSLGTFRDGKLNLGGFILGKSILGMKPLGGAEEIGAIVSLELDKSDSMINLPSFTVSGIALWIAPHMVLKSKRELTFDNSCDLGFDISAGSCCVKRRLLNTDLKVGLVIYIDN